MIIFWNNFAKNPLETTESLNGYDSKIKFQFYAFNGFFPIDELAFYIGSINRAQRAARRGELVCKMAVQDQWRRGGWGGAGETPFHP